MNMLDIIRSVESSAIAAPETKLVAWDSEVFAGPLLTPRGEVVPGMVGVYAANGAFLGTYANGEKILPNLQLVGIFEDALRSMGLTWKRTIHCDGYTFRARYVLSIVVQTPDNRPVNLTVEIQNSYNGALKVGALIQALRLICANGLMGLSPIFGLSRRHSAQLDASSIAQTMASKVEEETASMAHLFAAMAQRTITRDQGRFIIRNLSGKSAKMPARLAREIETAFNANSSPGSEDISTTLWGLYQAGTFILSQREQEGFAIAPTQNAYWGEVIRALALPSVAPRGLTWEAMTAPRAESEAYPARGE